MKFISIKDQSDKQMIYELKTKEKVLNWRKKMKIKLSKDIIP